MAGPAPSKVAGGLGWVVLLYFASGLPFGLVNDAAPVALRQSGAGLEGIGLLSAVGLAWTLKFLWAPAADRLGSRTAWLSGSQLACAAAFAALALAPAGSGAAWACLALAALASATQDLAVDGYCVARLPREEVPSANALRVASYRAALLFSGGLLVSLSAFWGWTGVWAAAAGLFALAAAASSRLAPAPMGGSREPYGAALRRLVERPGAAAGLAFVFLYKLGDYAMAPMTRPFLVDQGLGAGEIGLAAGTFGVGATMLGAFAGAEGVRRLGLGRALLLLGAAQAGSNLGYAAAALEPAKGLLWGAILLEAFCAGLGTTAFLSFLMDACERGHGAAQFALLSALFGLGRSAVGSVSGWAAAALGWPAFFAATLLMALPALALAPAALRWLPKEPKPA